MTRFHGILPAIVTPFDAQDRFNPAAFEALAARLYPAGVDGLYVCGQTGEGLQQSAAQRKLVAECAVACSPAGKQVIVHIGAGTTAESVDLAKHASRAGAHAVSSLPPLGSYSFPEIREYYAAIAAAAEVPLLIYYFPNFSPAIATTEQALELCAIPNVIGLKFTAPDFFRLWCLKRSGAVVYNGYDEMLISGLVMGADGGIGTTYNLMPERFAALYRHSVAGDWDQAKAEQDVINELIAVLLRYPFLPATKLLLKWSGIDCGECIEPRRRLTAAEEAGLRAEAAQAVAGQELLSSVPA